MPNFFKTFETLEIFKRKNVLPNFFETFENRKIFMTNQWYDEDGETYARYRDKPKFSGRGGYRGGGRKPTEAAGYTATIWARVSDEDKEKYLALGGSDFLRKAIREAYASKGGSRVDSN